MVRWPTADKQPPPEGCDGRTTLMLRAMAQASEDALFGGDHADDRTTPVDRTCVRPVRRWEDD